MGRQLVMNLETPKHPWGNLCNLNSSLIWAKYGYWLMGYEPPSWYDDELKFTDNIINIIQSPDVRYDIKFGSITPNEVVGTFCCWDEANTWIEPWEVRFCYKSKDDVIQHYKAEYLKHKKLHDGVINALLHYKKTGEPIEPDWLPRDGKTNFHWLKKNYKPEKYKGFRTLLNVRTES